MFELAERLQSSSTPEAMLWMLAKVTLILAIGRLLLAALPRASAATKHLIATAALIAVAALPLVSVIAPKIDLNVGRPAQSARAETRPALIGVLDDDAPIATAISVAKATGIADKPLTILERSMHLATTTWKGMLLISVGAISVLMLLHMLLGMLGVARVAKRATEFGSVQGVRLLKSDQVAVPVVWGIFKPVLLLPMDADQWPSERLNVVVLHELAHLQRWDGLSLILTRIAVSLFWFHPLAWSLDRAGRSECERACDDLVLASGAKPSDYADHLLAIAREMPAFDPFRSVTLAMSRKTQLEGRLLSILQRDVARRVFSGRGVAIACALAVAVIAPIAAMRLVAKPSEEKNKPPVVKEAKLKSDSEVTVMADVDSIGDFMLAKFGGTPTTGRGWYDRAYDLYHDDHYVEAATAFRKAAEDGFKRGTSYYNAACSYALAGDAPHATQELENALNAGWDDYDAIADDSDFDAIRDDARFRQLVSSRLGDAANRRSVQTLDKYNDLRADKTRDADDWYDVGLDLLRLRKTNEAIDAFQHAIATGEKTGSSMYNIACAYSLANDPANGMPWLRKSIENGYSDDALMQTDPDIALLRQQPGFDELRKLAKDLEMRGCCNGPISLFYDDWRESAKHHAEVVKTHPDSGRAWFNLGFTSLQARDFDTARNAFQRAIELDYRRGTSSYNIACAYALQKNNDAAFDWLERARTAGFDVADHAEDDEDLDALHRDPRWKGVSRSDEN
jgi:beta-lactamase regulating signal transducer with metallopeptidase domain/tetratricopeptide (TPR) repeat protein